MKLRNWGEYFTVHSKVYLENEIEKLRPVSPFTERIT